MLSLKPLSVPKIASSLLFCVVFGLNKFRWCPGKVYTMKQSCALYTIGFKWWFLSLNRSLNWGSKLKSTVQVYEMQNRTQLPIHRKL